MIGGVVWNGVHVNRVSNELIAQIEVLPDIGTDGCFEAVQMLNDQWQRHASCIEFSAGFVAVDRISEYASTLLACAACGDVYGYQTARVLLLDAIKDVRRSECLSLEAMF